MLPSKAQAAELGGFPENLRRASCRVATSAPGGSDSRSRDALVAGSVQCPAISKPWPWARVGHPVPGHRNAPATLRTRLRPAPSRAVGLPVAWRTQRTDLRYRCCWLPSRASGILKLYTTQISATRQSMVMVRRWSGPLATDRADNLRKRGRWPDLSSTGSCKE